jgi:hypothetical protein
VRYGNTTRIAYYPGCFAEFHDGHMAVIRQVLSILKEEGGDYRLIIAPANSDYTMSKYGDVLQASNKYRYDRIVERLRAEPGMERVHIDLNPMLNFDRDHNFPDMIDDFLKGQGWSLDAMKSRVLIVCGKDRDWSMLNRVKRPALPLQEVVNHVREIVIPVEVQHRIQVDVDAFHAGFGAQAFDDAVVPVLVGCLQHVAVFRHRVIGIRGGDDQAIIAAFFLQDRQDLPDHGHVPVVEFGETAGVVGDPRRVAVPHFTKVYLSQR